MFTWTPEMIRLMQNVNAHSEYHRQLAAILAPKLAGCRTLCDAGCGLGSLSAALSPYFDAITAADVSDAALDVLRETMGAMPAASVSEDDGVSPIDLDLGYVLPGAVTSFAERAQACDPSDPLNMTDTAGSGLSK